MLLQEAGEISVEILVTNLQLHFERSVPNVQLLKPRVNLAKKEDKHKVRNLCDSIVLLGDEIRGEF